MHRTVSKNLGHPTEFCTQTSNTTSLPPLVEDRMTIGARLDAAVQESSLAADKADTGKVTFIKVCNLDKGQYFVSLFLFDCSE